MTKLSAAIHAELLASVFATLVPSLVMSVLFVAVGIAIVPGSGDVPLHVLFAAGVAASVVRLTVTFALGRRIAVAPPDPATAHAIERRFATVYLVFAALLGLFAARAVAILPDATDMLVAVVIVGYAAGVSTGAAFRPAIALPSMTVSTVPAIVAAAAGGDAAHMMLALLLAGLLAGGVRSTLVRYRAALREIELRHLFATLARSDPLTGLPNRLALTEHLVAVSASAGVVLHCIDLDDFKLINDTHGHPIGDAVLHATAGRLTRLLDPGDAVARLGGDEFVIVRAPGRDTDPELFSLRISLALSEPIAVGNVRVAVGASVGWAALVPGDDPATAIARADRALYRSKRHRAGDRALPRPVAVAERLPPRQKRRSRSVRTLST